MLNDKINQIVTVLSTIITLACSVKIIALAINMAVNPDNKSSYITKIKNILMVVAITLLVSSYSIWGVVAQYFSTF